mmetsp:Transcript_26346/g.55053  ORF Transcript_26346/g.55053 Transcript_26346/m.55053 type:complete len:591 (-) Transcript_26346:625-2397(-)
MKMQELKDVRRLGHDSVLPSTNVKKEVESTPSGGAWVRGVNIGGWLLMERYITPYQFALTSCHVEGDLCWYPGQVNAPPNAELCDIYRCKPILEENVFGEIDYPIDEHTLWKSFGENIQAAEAWLNHHLENFITEDDIIAVKKSGATHVRVPLAHWILKSQEEITAAGDYWIVGQRWEAFRRVVKWARAHDLQVWPDIHTAPGSQNGFDNSGQQYTAISCKRWSDNSTHVAASLDVIHQVTKAIADENMQDVVTGFGLLNEPFKDCDREVYFAFLEQGFDIVRANMGKQAHVYVSDLFQPGIFNNGEWWLDAEKYHNTYLDTHYYQVFAETTRSISPRQHIALTCQNEYHQSRASKEPAGGVASCCFQDPPRNSIPSQGVRHMVGEWSVAVDTLPGNKLFDIMQNILEKGIALELQRKIPLARQQFLRNFAEAQMVTYEMADKGAGGAWFYWTVKMEGGAFAEWDYLRGIREGWIPKLQAPNVTSASLYGTCYEIMARTDDNTSVIHEYPDPDEVDTWLGPALDDDVVLSHGQSILDPKEYRNEHRLVNSTNMGWWVTGIAMVILVAVLSAYRRFRNRKSGYTSLPQSAS